MIPSLPERVPNTHKGDYGRVVCIGGSRGMAGAIALSGMAALRAGAGWVVVGTAASQQTVVASFEPCYMTVALADDEAGKIACSFAEAQHRLPSADAIAYGPGLGRSPALDRLSQQLFHEAVGAVVFDADGLNALAEAKLQVPRGPRVLTPHPGEFRRLAPDETANEEAARRLADRLNSVVVLKGHHSVVTNGDAVHVNRTGNAGMATAGSGDVLTGVIAALLGQGLDAFDAAVLGTHVHGLSGDLAAEEVGQVSLVARDLIRFLPQAFRECDTPS